MQKQIDGSRMHFLRRVNGSINVGGTKVMPEELELVIGELPEIAFVEVRARRSAMVGNLVEAAIAVAAGIAFDVALKRKIAALCRERLAAFKVPPFIVVTPDIVLTTSGKLSLVAVS